LNNGERRCAIIQWNLLNIDCWSTIFLIFLPVISWVIQLHYHGFIIIYPLINTRDNVSVEGWQEWQANSSVYLVHRTDTYLYFTIFCMKKYFVMRLLFICLLKVTESDFASWYLNNYNKKNYLFLSVMHIRSIQVIFDLLKVILCHEIFSTFPFCTFFKKSCFIAGIAIIHGWLRVALQFFQYFSNLAYFGWIKIPIQVSI